MQSRSDYAQSNFYQGFAKKQPDEFVPSALVDGSFKGNKNCAVLCVVCILKFFVLILLVP